MSRLRDIASKILTQTAPDSPEASQARAAARAADGGEAPLGLDAALRAMKKRAQETRKTAGQISERLYEAHYKRLHEPVLCEDKEAQHCPTWARDGECDRNPIWMLGHCRFSCKHCEPPAAAVAVAPAAAGLAAGAAASVATAAAASSAAPAPLPTPLPMPEPVPVPVPGAAQMPPPCLHVAVLQASPLKVAAAADGGSTAPPGGSLLAFLAAHKLEPAMFMPYLNELGATSAEDLRFVEPDDIKALKMKPIPRNKLLAALVRLKSGKDEL